MANIEKMEAVFEDVLKRYVGAEKSYVGTLAGGGTDYKRNLEITDQHANAFRKRFKEAMQEEAAEPTEPVAP
ncbi:hypothetical protein TCA2_4432 [Paenibacillus sp. TCA20]|uniref:Uncharacterized protein n=1 Tax=Paenibacillus urinalis TaxID=521520 RepID=A0ABY7XK42_9BACL|nr:MULTISPECIES: hypothetical protein [Paenibacillus]WDI05230.1 hypothetical protein PUW25_25820 [Paenibacillus urinalis]GAK41940.1 hypothetical protein TCA2_4432 [Paenibacillus sp. TCA20]